MALLNKQPASRSPRPRSRRPSINTYYRAETKQGDSPFVKKAAKRQVRTFLLGFLDIIILGLLLLVLVYALALRNNPVIEANDFSYHSKSAYAAAARVQLSSLKNRNKISFDESGVAQALQKQFPEISEVQIELPFFSEQPVVHLSIARPSFVLSSDGNSLIVDSAGMAVASAASLPIKGLPTIEDKSGYPARAGLQVVGSDSVNFINNLIEQCRRSKVPIASLSLPAEPQELQLRTRDTKYYVKFYLGGDVLQEAGQFLAARQHFMQNHQPPAEYLDVRVPGKIFYK